MIKWKRGLDDRGRLWTFVLNDVTNVMTVYHPESDSAEFKYADGNAEILDGVPAKYWRNDYDPKKYDDFKTAYHIIEDEDATATPGMHYPRMWRGNEHPPLDQEARTATKRVARSLLARLRDVFQVVEPVRAHDSVYGHELRQLLILACTEVESSWRAVLVANGVGAQQQPPRFTTNDYVKLLQPMKLDEYALELAAHPSYGVVEPFAGWNANNPTQSLFWYDAYNATKHNREDELPRATMRAVVYALAAVHIMTVAQFGFDDIARTLFHPDEFDFVGAPRWLGDAYIRPLLMPDQPLYTGAAQMQRAPWPTAWTAQNFPF